MISRKHQPRAAITASEHVLMRVLKLQWSMVILVGAAAALFSGDAALSATAGGIAYALPSSLFALVLMVKTRAQGANPVSFLIGEATKIVLCIAILGLINNVLPTVIWPAVVLGLALVAKSQLAVFIFK
jgi:ATP synthase protein I